MMQFVRETMTVLSSCFLTRLPQSSHCKFVSSVVCHLLLIVWSLARTVSSFSPNSKFQNCKTELPLLSFIQLHPLLLHRVKYWECGMEYSFQITSPAVYSNNSISGPCCITNQSISGALLGLVFISSQ